MILNKYPLPDVLEDDEDDDDGDDATDRDDDQNGNDIRKRMINTYFE